MIAEDVVEGVSNTFEVAKQNSEDIMKEVSKVVEMARQNSEDALEEISNAWDVIKEKTHEVKEEIIMSVGCNLNEESQGIDVCENIRKFFGIIAILIFLFFITSGLSFSYYLFTKNDNKEKES